MKTYDAIVIGAGHNGLVAATYLAKAGRKVVVVERRSMVGGIAITEEFYPGFRFSAVASGAGSLSPEVIADLNLSQHGLEFLPTEAVIFAPQPDGSALTIWNDTARTAHEIERFSAEDASHYPAFLEFVGKLAEIVRGLMSIRPPQLFERNMAELMALAPLGLKARGVSKRGLSEVARVLPMSSYDFLREWFDSEALKGAIAANSITGLTFGPRASGTNYVLLYNAAGANNRLFRSSGHVKGGMGTLSEALASAARRAGVEIRTDAEAAEIVVSDGRASAIRLARGEELSARAIVSSADPQTTFQNLIDPVYLDPTFLWQVGNIKMRGSAARVHLALSRLPDFTALNGTLQEALQGSIQIAPGLDYLEKAYDATKYGEYSEKPYLDVTIPSMVDASLAPQGQHTMSIGVQYAPYCLRDGDWDQRREEFGDHVIRTLAEYAPDIEETILHREVLTPLDLERVYGLPEGNITHGEMTLDQFLYMRPVPGCARYDTPLANLYLCGSGSHPGGGVTGMPGRNAARAILKG